MQRPLLILVFLLAASCGFAQGAQDPLDPKSDNPDVTPSEIHFTLSFPQATPPYYTIAVEATGRAQYKSTPQPNNEGDPYQLEFVASQTTRERVFELARQLNFFEGDYDYTKTKIAFTGTKTLTYKNRDQEHTTSYNWSQNPQIQEITQIFQDIYNTVEMGRQLQDKYRFDKLGVDSILTSMENEAKENHLGELQILQPLLTRMAKDTSLMNISRRRAAFLLSRIPAGETAAPGPAPQ
jgi:hypothetical protein